MSESNETFQNIPADSDLPLAWEGIEPLVQSFYENNLKKYSDETSEEYTERLQEKIEGEKYFFEEVLRESEALVMDTNNKTSIILFDIDETIGKALFDKKGNFSGTLLRPALLPLLEHIQQKFPHVEIGFITTRSKEGVMDQLEDEHQFASIKKFLSLNRMYSVARQEVYMSTDEQSEFIKNSPVINQASVTEETEWHLNSGDILKLKVLEELQLKEPHTGVLAVDDFQYAGLLKRGVCLNRKGKFALN